jgi:hypothetical protein
MHAPCPPRTMVILTQKCSVDSMPKSGRWAPRCVLANPYVSCLSRLSLLIKDVKSSNGTIINLERLSPEGLESEPYELKSDDIVVHPSACSFILCFSLSRRNSTSTSSARTRPSFTTRSPFASAVSSPSRMLLLPLTPSHTNSTNAYRTSPCPLPPLPGQMPQGEFPKFAQGSNNPARRLPMQPQGLGGSERPPGNSTQPHSEPTARGASESPETGAELHNPTRAMNNICDPS